MRTCKMLMMFVCASLNMKSLQLHQGFFSEIFAVIVVTASLEERGANCTL